MKVGYAFSQAVLPVGAGATVDLLVRFEAETKPDTTRRPLNLSLVIDRSGSMAGTPLRYAVRAAKDLVDRLGADDILSIVTYDDHVQTIVAPTNVTDRAAIHGKLDAVRVGGTTNLAGGWLEGCKHVLAKADSERVNRVLLLTDGNANVGITDKDLLTNTAKEKAEAGVVTTALGFGDYFNEDLLIGLARASGGNFYFIQSPDDASGVFQIELDSLKSVVAQNLTAVLIPINGVKIAMSSGYRLGDAGGKVAVYMGDVYDGEAKKLALSVTITAPGAVGSLPLLGMTYEYDGVVDKSIAHETGAQDIAVPVGTIDEAASAAPATGVVVEIAGIRIARAKDEAVELADAGTHADAARLLRDLVAELDSRGLGETFEIAEEMEQLRHYAERIEKKQMGSDVRKELRDQSYQARSRSNSSLSGRGVSTATDAVKALPTTGDVGSGVELECYREGGKLRVRVVTKGYDDDFNVQFPRAIRAEGVHYVADNLETSADGTFYRAVGDIKRLLKAGAADPFTSARSSAPVRTGKASVAPPTAADLPETDSVGAGVMVQVIKEGSKLRARVVSDGYDPDWNMRFPRSIREEGMMYVVDEVNEISGGGQYQACGTIKRFVQAK
ncbi:MAG: VWA domain-containing protein [Armatimonadetes bacterium]|nr:VWA domain-containing protein [Armatimonadota bacterium]